MVHIFDGLHCMISHALVAALFVLSTQYTLFGAIVCVLDVQLM